MALAVKKSRVIPLKARTINNPYHVLVEMLPRGTFLRIEMGMLKLDHQVMVGAYIRDVLLTGLFIVLDALLPLGRELVFPGTMPLGLLLPPPVADPLSAMRPMPYPSCSALGSYRLQTYGA